MYKTLHYRATISMCISALGERPYTFEPIKEVKRLYWTEGSRRYGVALETHDGVLTVKEERSPALDGRILIKKYLDEAGAEFLFED
jgi:hypothetical protein